MGFFGEERGGGVQRRARREGGRGDPMGPMGRLGLAQRIDVSAKGKSRFDGFDDSSDSGGSSGGQRGGGGRRNYDEDDAGAGGRGREVYEEGEDSPDTSDHADQEENDETDATWANVYKRKGLSLWLHNAHEYCNLHFKCVPLKHNTHAPPQPTPTQHDKLSE